MRGLTIERLKEVLSFDQETGIFRWKVRMRQRACSEIAGSVNPDGYRQICIDQKIHKAHRLAWFYVNGNEPDGMLDHINGDRLDNRISNLRLASASQNTANSRKRRNNSCGYKGVYLHKLSGLYMARITVNYKSILVGYYRKPEDAHAAYVSAAQDHFGAYARGG